MPSNPANYKISAGELDTPIQLFTVNPDLDSAGSVVDPASTAVDPIFAWDDFAGKIPYQGVEIRDALAKIGETWATFAVRYQQNRQPLEGMRLKDLFTLEEFEITGVLQQPRHARVELTCRKIK